MKRMQYHHHKFALTLTIFLVAMLGVSFGIQIEQASEGGKALSILSFGFLMVLLVVNFIMLSMLLRTRDELHDIHADLSKCFSTKKAAPKRKK